MKTFIFILISFIFFSLFLAADTLKTNKKTLKDIVIQEETFDKIIFYYQVDSRKSRQTLDRSREKILEIQHSEVPLEYQSAEEALRRKVYSRALEGYQDAMRRDAKWIQHCLYKIALCYEGMGNHARVVSTYRKLLESFPNTYYKADAYFGLGTSYAEGKKWSNAAQSLAMAEKLYEQILETEKSLECRYLIAQTTEKAGDYEKAILTYEGLRSKMEDPSSKRNLELSLASCYEKARRFPQAKALFLSLSQELEPANKEAFGILYLGLGNCLLEERKTTEALLCYLRVVLLYEMENEATKLAYDRAAYCCDLLKNEKPEYSDRARQLRQRKEQKFRE